MFCQGNVIFTKEVVLWMIVTGIVAVIYSFLDNLIFLKVFDVKVSKKKISLVIAVDSLLRFLCILFVPSPYYRALYVIITIILFKFIYKATIEKCIFGEVANMIITIVFEVIFSKLFCALYFDLSTYGQGMYDYEFVAHVWGMINLLRFLILLLVIKMNFKVEISNNLSRSNKWGLIVSSTIGAIIIYSLAARMSKYINVAPYYLYLLDITILVLYFIISMKNVIRMTTMETQNEKIQNLEAYNKTLSYMYDNIRGFRHDYGNFVQGLNGYVSINDMDGVSKMVKSALEECKNINEIGVLNPETINNPAIYSILTNKYYKAKSENIDMRIEFLIDANDLKIPTYELNRMLGILIDNAIEAASESKERIINIRFFKDQKVKRNVIIIENSYVKKDIDIEQMFEKGVTSKKDTENKHGLGLWTVRRLLNKFENLNLYTNDGEMFLQQLEVYDN